MMQTALLLATLGLLSAAAHAQPQPAPSAAQPQTPAQAAPPAEVPKPAAGPAKIDLKTRTEAPSVPTGQMATQAAIPVPDTGVLRRVDIQGNRRVETDAI